MFHRLLVRLTGADAQIPVADLTVRVASTSGAVDTSKVKDWPGGGSLPPHIAGYQQGFFNRYQDPTENRAQLDRLAAEFPNLVTAVNLPHLSPGYQRKAQTIAGAWAGTGTNLVPFTNQTGSLAAAEAPRAVILSSKAWGHEGGNGITAQLVAGTGANAPLLVGVDGKAIKVTLGTGADGAVTSTAAQVVAAINASPAASALVTAATYRGNAGAGIPRTSGEVQTLADFLNAPAHVQRGPFQQRVYRIGAHRDGTKVGVFFTCQTHAREWTTGLTCVETAERLVRNYATDPETKKLLDNTEVFIHANGNPDGGHYSMYDFASQRRNLSNHCDAATNNDPLARNTWGVDLNRNYTEYTRFDGAWVGASASCTSDSYSGPSEASEPETKNDMWIADTYPNIKFASNMHSFGGYFMWSPGAYLDDGKRTLSPAPNIGVEKYFFEAGEKILGRIKEFRGTVITPARTGPIADVIYSGAGSLGGRPLVPQGHHRLRLRDRRRPVRLHRDGHAADPDGLPAAVRRGDRQRRPAAGQRGPRAGDGVRLRQLRHDRGRLRLRAGHHAAADGDRGLGAEDVGRAGALHVQLARRGGRDPLHHGRLDADAGLAARTTPSARAASARC